MRNEHGRLETANSQVAASLVIRVSIFVFLSIVPQRRHESALIARHHHHNRRGKGLRLFKSDHGSQPVPNRSGTAPTSAANAAPRCNGGGTCPDLIGIPPPARDRVPPNGGLKPPLRPGQLPPAVATGPAPLAPTTWHGRPARVSFMARMAMPRLQLQLWRHALQRAISPPRTPNP